MCVCVCVCVFFIHASVSGHIGCFHVLRVENNAAMNIGVHVSFIIVVFSGICPVVGLLGHMVVLFLVSVLHLLFSH